MSRSPLPRPRMPSTFWPRGQPARWKTGRRQRPRGKKVDSRLGGLVRLALSVVLLAACGSAPDNAKSSTSFPGALTPADKSTTSPAATLVRITIGDTMMTGRLLDNTTANDLAAQLPLTLTFRDLNGVEKTAPLPRKLSVDGMPAGDDPNFGDIGYWAPDGDLVFYYGDVGYWTGIVRIGEFDGDIGAIAEQSSDFTATVDRVS